MSPFLAIWCGSQRIVAGCAQHRVQPITRFTLEVTAVHPVNTLEVPDDRLDGLAPLKQLVLVLADAFVLAPMRDDNLRVVRIHTSAAQIRKGRGGPDGVVLHEDAGMLQLLQLLQLLGQGVSVVRVAIERPGAHGAWQGSCRVHHAAKTFLSDADCTAMLTTTSRSGFKITASTGLQLRVWRDQREGLRSRACRYTA